MYEQPFNPYAKNVATVKDYFRSPAVLILAIAKALSAILALVGTIMLSSHIKDLISYSYSAIRELLEQIGVSSDFRAQVNDLFAMIDQAASPAASISPSISSLVVTGLVVAAFLIIYFKSRNADPASSPSIGFSILFAFAVIELIVAILGILAILAVFVLLIIVYGRLSSGSGSGLGFEFGVEPLDELLGYFREPQVLLVLVIVGIVVLAIAAFFLLFTCVNKVRYYRSVKKSLSTVELHSEGAKPYGVMCVLSAISTGLSLLSIPSSLFANSSVRTPKFLTGFIIVSMIAQAASLVAIIMEAKLALGYKNHIDTIKYGYSRHAAPAAPYSPFPMGTGYTAPQNQPMNNPYIQPAPVQQEPTVPENRYADPYGADAPYQETAPLPEQEAAPAAAPTCPLCGAEVDPDAPFCGNCGNKL